MRLKQVAELIKVNLLYANPQLIEKKRNRENKTGQKPFLSAPKTVLANSLLILVLFSVLYGFMLGGIDFSQYPGFFTVYLLLFSVMTILQGFYIIFNLFYESKDLEYYLPLPFLASEIFSAKLAVVVMTVLPYLAPAGVILYRTSRTAGHSVLQALLSALLLFLLLMFIVFFLAVIFVHLVTKLAFFQKNKKTAATVLYSLASIGMIFAILFISNLSTDVQYPLEETVLPDYRPLPFLKVLHDASVDPFSIGTGKGLALWAGLLLLLGFFLYKRVVPEIYRASPEAKVFPAQEKKRIAVSTKRAASLPEEPVSVNRTLWKYNFGLIQDGTLMLQFLSSNLIIPIFMIGPLLMNQLSFSEIPNYFWGLFFLAGFIYNFLTLQSTSVIGVIISLDRENFLYMKSLPFSMRNYLRQKFLFAFLLEAALPVLVTSAMLLYAKVPLLLLFFFLMGLIVGLFAMCQFYFVRDYRLLDLEWQNLTELFGRGGGNIVQAFVIFGTIIIGAAVIAGSSFLLLSIGPAARTAASLGMMLIPLLIAGFLTVRYQKLFWTRFW